MKDSSPAKNGKSEKSAKRKGGLIVIAIFKLIKGTLLLAAGVGILSLIHKDVADVVYTWLDSIRVDPDNQYIHAIMSKILFVDDRKLAELSAGTFFYAALLLTEGVGLAMRKRWAEYFTIIVTGSFIPLEIYELVTHAGPAKVIVLIINVAIVSYLVRELRRKE